MPTGLLYWSRIEIDGAPLMAEPAVELPGWVPMVMFAVVRSAVMVTLDEVALARLPLEKFSV